MENTGTLQHLILFLKNPKHALQKPSRPWRIFFTLLVINFVLTIFSIAFVTLGELITGMPQNMLEQDFIENALFVVFFAVILAPLLEETVFRFFVTSFNPVKIIVSVLSGLFFFADDLSFPMIILIIIGICWTLIAKDKINSISLHKVRHLWNTNFMVIFYCTALFFGFYHITNWDIPLWSISTLIALPLLTLPQMITGLILGYTRIRLGFVFAVALHALNNTLLVIPSLFA